MKEADALKAVNSKFVDHWKNLLSLTEWDIQFRYTKMEDGDLGECSVEAPHKMATIVVDVVKHRDANHLLDTVRHELFHVFHAQFEHHRSAATKFLAPNAVELMDELYMLGAEDVVLKMEHLMAKLSIDVHGKMKK